MQKTHKTTVVVAIASGSAVPFNPALTYGLEDEPLAALERMVGLVEKTGEMHSVEYPLQMTLGLNDGERLHR